MCCRDCQVNVADKRVHRTAACTRGMQERGTCSWRHLQQRLHPGGRPTSYVYISYHHIFCLCTLTRPLTKVVEAMDNMHMHGALSTAIQPLQLHGSCTLLSAHHNRTLISCRHADVGRRQCFLAGMCVSCLCAPVCLSVCALSFVKLPQLVCDRQPGPLFTHGTIASSR